VFTDVIWFNPHYNLEGRKLRCRDLTSLVRDTQPTSGGRGSAPKAHASLHTLSSLPGTFHVPGLMEEGSGTQLNPGRDEVLQQRCKACKGGSRSQGLTTARHPGAWLGQGAWTERLHMAAVKVKVGVSGDTGVVSWAGIEGVVRN
jgi:hypothetical protein